MWELLTKEITIDFGMCACYPLTVFLKKNVCSEPSSMSSMCDGTTLSFYGLSKRTIILGKGRREQAAFIPDIVKESYGPKGKNLFDLISPQLLTQAMVS